MADVDVIKISETIDIPVKKLYMLSNERCPRHKRKKANAQTIILLLSAVNEDTKAANSMCRTAF